MSLKCFYCNSQKEEEGVLNCSNCGKELSKLCKKCNIKYEQSANFCMSCGGKLSDIDLKDEEIFILEEVNDDTDDEISTEESVEESELLEIEVSDEDNTVDSKKEEEEEFAVIDDKGELPLQKTGKKLEVSKDDKKFDEDEDMVFETEKKSTKVDIDPSPEKDKSYFGTTSKSKSVEPDSSKNKKHSKADKKESKTGKREAQRTEEEDSGNNVDFDSLFEQLSNVNSETETKTKITEYDDDSSNLLENVPEINELELKKIKSQPGKKTESILIPKGSDTYLKSVKIDDAYSVSFDLLREEVITSEFEESCIPLLKTVEESLSQSKGGIFFLRGDAGNGTGILVNRLKKFAEENNSSLSYNIAVSDANGFDFDFMIFIDLLRKLMKIKSSDVGTVRKKFDKLFGESLPKNKKECLSALICLNFIPLKTKLPKHDIEYLLAYVFYGLSRGKPVVWFINNANVLN
ncbi:MAG TPA: hypothetical protein ENN58_02405, partial [bacterium]|nr:hypothetical protein [bacterium]